MGNRFIRSRCVEKSPRRFHVQTQWRWQKQLNEDISRQSWKTSRLKVDSSLCKSWLPCSRAQVTGSQGWNTDQGSDKTSWPPWSWRTDPLISKPACRVYCEKEDPEARARPSAYGEETELASSLTTANPVCHAFYSEGSEVRVDGLRSSTGSNLCFMLYTKAHHWPREEEFWATGEQTSFPCLTSDGGGE